MAWAKLGTETLGSAGDTLEVSFTAKKYLCIQSWQKAVTNTIVSRLRVGNSTIDTGTNYAYRSSNDGGADATNLNDTNITLDPTVGAVGTSRFQIIFIVNNASNEKLFIIHDVDGSTAGATTAPKRTERVGKWVNTSNQIDIIRVYNDSSGDFDTDSNLSALGTD
jgi:hypothetical protein